MIRFYRLVKRLVGLAFYAHIVAQTFVYAENLMQQFGHILGVFRKKMLIGMPSAEVTPHRPEMDPQP